ncbi:recombination protein RecR [Desulfallas sp. Bu1-1]|jgi:recombination protein RecR|uniref:recombination mediator RecR n=1 Tax=Desulfallas sp. Bu1-1 TaxID=2787620 RepID=UPI0018A104C2|nr:recombination mediator RecR [Desulfallas sp. Bu1-1]MBF7084172.1 recombination protein RecR [Desulfallas sp. Bu1-1]
MQYAGAVSRLIGELARLPGIGSKTAQRLAFFLLNAPPEVAENLAAAIREARATVTRCSVCGNLTDIDPCAICSDQTRDRGVICLVQDPRDVAAVEKYRGFKGVYHVLHGALSPLAGVGPEQLNIKSLLARLEGGDVQEVILATNPDVEGDATALYLARLIKPLGVRVTRIAHGLPVGAHLEYADEITLGKAIEGRREIK